MLACLPDCLSTMQPSAQLIVHTWGCFEKFTCWHHKHVYIALVLYKSWIWLNDMWCGATCHAIEFLGSLICYMNSGTCEKQAFPRILVFRLTIHTRSHVQRFQGFILGYINESAINKISVPSMSQVIQAERIAWWESKKKVMKYPGHSYFKMVANYLIHFSKQSSRKHLPKT
jgi:hypothetical protein